ncbi:MAG TPA: bifunctional UDP-N-acetylglucosamine diphosphorylase/glucosamine-1-phosphate N-acetyltransferase GlmU [Steroidobacteraceae bacterium]
MNRKSAAAPLSVLVLAAGQGKRMHSELPKVLQPLAGQPLLAHVLETAAALGAAAIHVVYGHGGQQVRAAIQAPGLNWVLQDAQLGTGHAVQQAAPAIPDDHQVLILYGDVPLIAADTLRALCALAGERAMSVLTVKLPDPTGYGRIVRGSGARVLRIVEQRDATARERAIKECNTGVIVAPARLLKKWVGRLHNRNTQGEYYLTDIVALAVRDKVKVVPLPAPSAAEVLGVNDRLQLAALETVYRQRRARELMASGVTLIDPARIDLRGAISVGRDVVIEANVLLQGPVMLGDGVRVGANCVLSAVNVGRDTVIEPNSVLEGAEIGERCRIGPFARLRPGTRLHAGVHVGNYVEVKNSELQAGSKANHLSYLGDAEIGAATNIGAGTITCNYDGADKHRTTIGARAFIGSGTMLVAPVSVGADATIGAGSTITEAAPAGKLTLARARQETIDNWQRPTKRK